MKATAQRDITVAGRGLEAHAFAAEVVDVCHVFVAPVVVGGGTPSLPNTIRVRLDLLDVRRFDHGMAHLHYRTRT